MSDERPNIFFCYERPRPIFVAGNPIYGLFPDVITTHLGIYNKGEATVKSTTYFPKFQTFGWYKDTGEIQMFYPSVYDPDCMLLFITEPNGTYWELGKMLKEELVYRTGGVLMGEPFSDWDMAPPPEGEKGHVTTCRLQSYHELIDVIWGMTRETRERKELKLSDPQEPAQHRFGARLGGKLTFLTLGTTRGRSCWGESRH
jgi:hypothetical protein